MGDTNAGTHARAHACTHARAHARTIAWGTLMLVRTHDMFMLMLPRLCSAVFLNRTVLVEAEARGILRGASVLPLRDQQALHVRVHGLGKTQVQA